jgi:hypothetical protein
LLFAEAEKSIENVATPRPSALPFIVEEAPPEWLPLPSSMNANDEVDANTAIVAIKVFIVDLHLKDW